jgi:hypothetical protein
MLFNFIKKKQPPLSKSLKKIKRMLVSKDPLEKRNLTIEDEKRLNKIKQTTHFLNKNNVTRTKAYIDFYKRHPEIHWAFLAHMVSRNGGWNMTDLKGGFLSRLLSKKESNAFFNFLERSNWLIFQDAYPQFLVYEESKRSGKNLFYYLPHLHVSTFMETMWNHFWNEADSYLLTISLIINEQNYLESRVLKNQTFQKNIFNTVEFKLQDFLALSHILFPYTKNGKMKLIGQTLHQFESLHERILLGKRLYNILFYDAERLHSIEKWAKEHPHSGSRMDYWPHLFHYVNEEVPGKGFMPRIKSCSIIKGMPRIYSPRLEFAWKNQKHDPADVGDWYEDWRIIYYLTVLEDYMDGEIENEYCKTLEKLELAAITKKIIAPF